jgi:hypothetical protein
MGKLTSALIAIAAAVVFGMSATAAAPRMPSTADFYEQLFAHIDTASNETSRGATPTVQAESNEHPSSGNSGLLGQACVVFAVGSARRSRSRSR